MLSKNKVLFFSKVMEQVVERGIVEMRSVTTDERRDGWLVIARRWLNGRPRLRRNGIFSFPGNLNRQQPDFGPRSMFSSFGIESYNFAGFGIVAIKFLIDCSMSSSSVFGD